MTETRRVIVVRRGDSSLYEALRQRYAQDSGVVVIYDRRLAARRSAGTARLEGPERRNGERRLPQRSDILTSRGYYVARPRPAR
jgi:hypothetical protein